MPSCVKVANGGMFLSRGCIILRFLHFCQFYFGSVQLKGRE